MKRFFRALLAAVLCAVLSLGVAAAEMSPGFAAPQTGDSTRVGPWIIVMVVSLVVLVVLALLSRNKSDKN